MVRDCLLFLPSTHVNAFWRTLEYITSVVDGGLMHMKTHYLTHTHLVNLIPFCCQYQTLFFKCTSVCKILIAPKLRDRVVVD